ncbi:putative two-component sensor kinase [Halobacteriovorax marinus SJ]|uniref:histidine kinase n=1 Tax=Halobacteriovorax marinus (strain ATCC BAA-682 / DSM 15412 / SJ) TaxID=862908 RepID=E1X272_HALMS|nr:HAMP domain-containing sensor histidine kinase [Halobacteriovorax marinus]CBW25028.1 putative two-component sensor kinase [Halobacteriovorax marinus SJ]
MENKSDSRTKKVKRSLKLYLSESIGGGVFPPSPNIEFSKSQINADYSIYKNEGLYDIHTGGSILGEPVLTVGANTNPLAIYQLLNATCSEKKSKKKRYSSLTTANISKSSSSDLKQFVEILEFKKFILDQSLRIKDTSELPEYILQSKLFKAYQTCQIMIHEKGSPIIETFYFDASAGHRKKEISVSSFSKIFNLVKKSKNKLFNQTSLLESDLDVVGTFLAKDIELSKHSILVIVSRNGFLPPSDMEINIFSSAMNFISDVIQTILIASLNKLRTEVYTSLLETYPNPIFLDNTPLNEAARLSNNHDLDEASNSEDKIGRRFLEIGLESESNTSDIYHHQRVSLLGELLNTLKHELSNPLFGLNMASDLLLLESFDEEMSSIIQDISINSKRCQTIIDNFSKLYRDEDNYEKFNIKEVINETILLTKSESKQIPKEINFYNFQDDQDYIVNSNSTWLSQIIFNLVINSSQAIKSAYQDLREQRIQLTIIKKLEEIEISVSDTGPGIPDKLKDEIFKPFITTKEKGTGLGLSICCNLIKKLNGKIEIDHKNENGTIVSFTLPIV